MSDPDKVYNSSASVAPSFLKSIEIQRTKDYLKNSTPTIISSTTLVDTSISSILAGDLRFIEMSLNESMLNPYISGHIDVRNEGDWIGQMNLSGTERAIIKFGFYDTDKVLEFICTIYSVKIINDFAHTEAKKTQAVGKTIIYRFEFISEEIFNNVFDKSILEADKDFIGYIATDKSSKIPGLVNTLASTLKLSPFEIEGTRNGIWLKSGEISFPSGVGQGQISIGQLMQYISKYAVSANNTNAVNYFFWKDREGWHFKSLESILKDKEIKATFHLTSEDEADPNKIRSVTVINQYDNLSLLNDKVFSSHYISVNPNYDENYSDFLSSSVGYTYGVVDYDYHRDFKKIKHIEKHKILSETIPTAVLRTDKTPRPATRLGADPTNLFGYYSETIQNTPFSQWQNQSSDMGFGVRPENPATIWWDYLYRKEDSRPNNIVWQPQYDMTELKVSTLYDIHHKIRVPLEKKRKEFVRLKNIKRKWEVYRCAVCCLDTGYLGSTADQKSLNLLQQNSSSTEYMALFGSSGPFSDLGQVYNVVAAGSFTDTLNYDPTISTHIRGLTFSYDLTKEPYNQTIGQFYNIKQEIPNYVKYVIERGLHLYTLAITEMERRLELIEDFLSYDFIGPLDALDRRFMDQDCLDAIEEEDRDIGKYPFGYRDPSFTVEHKCVKPYTFQASEKTIDDPNCNDVCAGIEDPEEAQQCFITNCFEDGDITKHKQIPNPLYVSMSEIPWLKLCSNSTIIRGGTHFIGEFDNLGYPIGYDLPYDVNSGNSTFDENAFWEQQHTMGGTDNTIIGEHVKCLSDGTCINLGCLDQITLEIHKRESLLEKKSLLVQIKLLKKTKQTLEEKYVTKWQEMYAEWWNRKAFFFSKNPGTHIFTGISGGHATKPLSLYNISSITRKPIRGSRYEILAKTINVATDEVGEWAYNIFFGNSQSIDPIGNRDVKGYTYNDVYFPGSSSRDLIFANSFHPYYDQGYSKKNGLGSFVTQRSPNYLHRYRDNNLLNDGSWESEFVVQERSEAETTEAGYYVFPRGQVDHIPEMEKVRLLEFDLNSLPDYSDIGYTETFNVFEDDLSNKKPPNIKKEEIASYVRIEFNKPIGLDRLSEFPSGFIRDAGSEYFLPYLVSLTPGPNGRQRIRNNIAVIGMDPYGFDVAIKKLPIENHSASKRYSWHEEQNHHLNETAMDLWPEYGFETERPYYTCDPKTEYTNSSTYHGNNTVNSTYSSWYGNDSRNYLSPNLYWGAHRAGSNPSNQNKSAIFENYNRNYDGKNISLSSSTDPEYKKTANGSGYLLHSHKKITPHRSWWSFDFPKNIYIPQKLFGLFSTLGQLDEWWKHIGVGAGYLFGRYGGSSFNGHRGTWGGADVTGIMIYGYHDHYWWYGEELDHWIKLADTPETRALLEQASAGSDAGSVSILPKSGDGFVETMSVHSAIPELEGFFNDATNHWMSGEHILYRPGMLTTDVWKYDLSGETEYGLVTPPSEESNYDIFDQNFAAQFVVHARSSVFDECDQYTCANPKGIVYPTNCPDEDPYCNCPALDLMPKEKEPTYVELYKLYQELKECALISEHLGDEYLGCVWSDPNNPCSCNCPEIGSKFKEYLQYNRTYATFWETPRHTPLLRYTQISQLFAQQIQILIAGTSTVNVGDIIYLTQYNPFLAVLEQKNLHGKWLVLGINHTFYKNTVQGMQLLLTRDTLPIEIDRVPQNNILNYLTNLNI